VFTALITAQVRIAAKSMVSAYSADSNLGVDVRFTLSHIRKQTDRQLAANPAECPVTAHPCPKQTGRNPPIAVIEGTTRWGVQQRHKGAPALSAPKTLNPIFDTSHRRQSIR
jgi:hypothetical protein